LEAQVVWRTKSIPWRWSF